VSLVPPRCWPAQAGLGNMTVPAVQTPLLSSRHIGIFNHALQVGPGLASVLLLCMTCLWFTGDSRTGELAGPYRGDRLAPHCQPGPCVSGARGHRGVLGPPARGQSQP